jgi:hypothetical protein
MRTSGRVTAAVVVLLAAALVLFTAVRAHGGGHPSLPASPGATTRDGLAAGRAGTSTPAASSPSGAGAAAAHANPFAAASAVAANRAGTVLAGVFDVRTGQTWQLGDGRPQAEASVVKLNILQALLARQGGAGLSPDDQSLAEQMIEDSDNDAATTLWDAAGGGPGLAS